jgi:hypothetical protein
LILIGNAHVAANRAHAAYQREHDDKEKRTKEAVPAFLDAARQAAEKRRLPNALDQLDVALTYEPDHAEARLLRGSILIAQADFFHGKQELENYTQNHSDAQAARLIELSSRPNPGEVSNLLAISQVFIEQGQPSLADHLLRNHGDDSAASRKALLGIYQKRLKAVWPRAGLQPIIDARGIFAVTLREATHLGPLEDMPLTALDLAGCQQLRDLTPLKGMPLNRLNLAQCTQVRDLSPLKGMRLTSLDLGNCTEVRDLMPLQGMPLTHLNVANFRQLDLTQLEGLPLTSLELYGCVNIRDLAPLKRMRLTSLNLTLCSQVHDLSPLTDLPLASLSLNNCTQVRDLTPLHGMQLTTLSLSVCGARDLTALKGMPLKYLMIVATPFEDLTPLGDLPLEEIRFTPRTTKKGLDVLRGMKSLKIIGVDAGSAWPTAEFWKKYDAGAFK